MTDAGKLRATGHINVTNYEAKPQDDAGTLTIAISEITEEFSGGLIGVGSSRLILVTEPGGGTVHFTGMERFLGKAGERSGSFILQNSGTLKDGALYATWRIISGSGAEGLEGIRGEGGCDPNGYTLDYWFE